MVGVECLFPMPSLHRLHLSSEPFWLYRCFKETLDQLEATILLFSPGVEIIIMGDFNADLGRLGGPMACTHINEHGKILHRYLTKWNFISTHLHLQPTTSSFTYYIGDYQLRISLHLSMNKPLTCKVSSVPFVNTPPLLSSILNFLIHDNKVYDNNTILDAASYFESLNTPVDIPFTSEQLLI